MAIENLSGAIDQSMAAQVRALSLHIEARELSRSARILRDEAAKIRAQSEFIRAYPLGVAFAMDESDGFAAVFLRER